MDVVDEGILDTDPLPDDASDDEGAPPSSGPGSTPTSCTSSPPQGEEPQSPHATVWAGSGGFFGTTASASSFSRSYFSSRRGPGRPRKEGVKLTKEGKVVRRYRGGNAGSVRGAKRQRISRDDSFEDLYDESDFTMPAPEEPPFFPEKWPGKFCGLCNLGERSQLGQGEMRQYVCHPPEGESANLSNVPSGASTPTGNTPSGSCTPVGSTTPNPSIDSVLMSPPHGEDSQSGIAVPLSRRQKGVNKCKTPLYNMEHTDELSIIGHAELMELSSLIASDCVYLHKNCIDLSPGGGEPSTSESGEDSRVKNVLLSALQRKCTFCLRYGASLTCKMNCSKYYHFPCMLASGGYLDYNIKAAFCKEHLYQVPVVCSSNVDCRTCGVVGDIANLMTCSTCGAHYHGTCVGLAQMPGVRAGWQCRGCRVCQVCRGEADSRSAACDQCDKLYHAACLRPPMASVPKYGWKCKCCRVCSDCGSRSPGAGPSSRWHAHYTVCDSCYQQRNKGSCCPLCRRAYRAAAQRDMIRCTMCKRYVHGGCDPDADPLQYQAKKEQCSTYEYMCPICKPNARPLGQEDDGQDASEDPTSEQDPLATDSKDMGLGKGKPCVAAVSSKIAKKRLSGYKSKGGFVAAGKLAYQKRQKSSFVDFSKKKTKTKMRGIFGVPGLGLQRPQPSLDSKVEDDTTAENKMILVSRDDKWVLSQDLCVMCGAIGTDAEGCLIACSQCGQTYHPYCVNVKISRVVITLGWRCLDCTVCEGCGRRGDEPRLLLCDDCDATYHTYCATPALTNVPKGAWKCSRCRRCMQCGSTTPGPAPCTWQDEYSSCAPCHSASVCSVCSRQYSLSELVIQCDCCTRWLHAACDSINSEDEAEVCCKAGYKCSACRGPDPPAPPAPPPAPPLADLGLAGEYYLDEVCLSARGAAAVRALQAELGTGHRRKRRTNKQEEADSTAQGDPDEREDGNNPEIKEEPADSAYKEGSSWEVGLPPPAGFSTYTTEAGLVVLRRKRTRNLNKLGVGGFLVRSRLKHEEDDGPATPQPNESPGNKRKPRRKIRSKLMEAYPSYIQEAFFGKELIDPKPVVSSTNPSESPGGSIPGTQTPDTYQNFFGKLDWENSDSESEDIISINNILNEYDPSSVIDLNEEETAILKTCGPAANEVDVKLEPSDDSAALAHALKGTAPPAQTEKPPSTSVTDGTSQPAPKEELALYNVNLDPLPNMDSTDVDEIFKGVLTDDSQESHESTYAAAPYPQKGQLTSPMNYTSTYSELSPAFTENQEPWVNAEPTIQTMQQPTIVQQVAVPQQMQPCLNPGMMQQSQVVPTQPATTYNQRSTDKMRADESLGPAATISAVLYANTNHPEWKTEFPNWSERCKQILKKWRALPGEQKAPFLQRARDNRSAIRMKKAQQGLQQSGVTGESASSTGAVAGVVTPTGVAAVASSGSSVVVRAPNVTVVGETIRVLTPSEIMRTLPRLHTEQERAAAAQRSARDLEQERAWKQRQARQQHDQRHAAAIVGGETPRAAFPAARFPLHYAPRHLPGPAAMGQISQVPTAVQAGPGTVAQGAAEYDRQLRDLLQPRGKQWQGTTEEQFRTPLPVVTRPQMPIANKPMQGVRIIESGDQQQPQQQHHQRPVMQKSQAQGQEKPNAGHHEGNSEEMDMGDIDKLDQDILGGLGGEDDEELLESLTAEMGDDFNILEYADPELDAFSDAHTAQILDALDLPDEPDRRDKGLTSEMLKSEAKANMHQMKADKDIKIEDTSGDAEIKQEIDTDRKPQDIMSQSNMGGGKSLQPGQIMQMQAQGQIIKMQGGKGQVIQMQNSQGQLIQMQSSPGKVIQMQGKQMQVHASGGKVVQTSQVQNVQNSGILQQDLSQLPPEQRAEALSQVLRNAPAPVRSIIRPYSNQVVRAGQPRQILTASGTIAYHSLGSRAPPPPPPYPGTRAPPPPPPPYPQHHQGGTWPPLQPSHKPLLLQEQPLLLEDLLEQEKREQERQTGWSTPSVVAGPPPAPTPLFTAPPPPPAPPPPTPDSDRATIAAYEHWMRRQQAYLADQLKHYEAEVQKLRKMRKSLNSKQRQLRKSGNELAPADAAELQRVSTEQAVLQKHLESARKQFRQHTTLEQEYQNKMQKNNPQIVQQTIIQTGVQGQHQLVTQQQLMSGQLQNVTGQHQLVSGQIQTVSGQMQGGVTGQHQLISGQLQNTSQQHQMVTGQIQNVTGSHQIVTGQIGFSQQGGTGVRNVRLTTDSPHHPLQSPLTSPMQSPLQSPMQSQSPLHPHRSPAQSPMHHHQFHQQSPMHAQQSPLHSQQSPLHAQQSPLHQQQSPMMSQQNVMHPQQSPMHMHQSPLSQQSVMHSPMMGQNQGNLQSPLTQSQLQSSGNSSLMAHSPQPPPQSPLHPPQSPLHSPMQSPLHTSQSPLHAVSSPLHAVSSPLHSVASPGRQMPSPQQLLQQLQRTSPQLPAPSRSPQIYQQSQIHSPVPSHSPQLQNVQSSFQRPSSASPMPSRFARPPHHQQGMRVGVVYGGRSPLGSPQPMMSPGNPTNESIVRQQALQRQQFSPSSPRLAPSPAPQSPDVNLGGRHTPHSILTDNNQQNPGSNDGSHGGGFMLHNIPSCVPPPGYRYSRLGLFGGSPGWPQDDNRRQPHITKVSILKRKPRPPADDDVVLVDDDRIATEEDFEELIDGGSHEEEEAPRPQVRTETTTKTVAVISLAAKRQPPTQPFKLATVSIANQTISVPVLKGLAVAGASRARSPVRPTNSNKPLASVISVISSGAGVPRVATLSPVIALATSTASRVPVSILTQHQVKQKIVKTIEKPTALGLSSITQTLQQAESINTEPKDKNILIKEKKTELDIEKEISQHTELPPTLVIPDRTAQAFLKPDIKSPDRIPETIPDNIMEGDDEDKPEDIPKPDDTFSLLTSATESKETENDSITTIKAIANQTQDMVVDTNMQMTSEISQESVQISIPSPTPSQEQYLNRITMQQHQIEREIPGNETKQVETIEDMLSMLETIDHSKMFTVREEQTVTNDESDNTVQQPTADESLKQRLEAKQSTNVSQLSPLSQPAELTTNMANVSQQLRTIMSSLNNTSKTETSSSPTIIKKNSSHDQPNLNQVNFENLLPSSKVETRIDSRAMQMQKLADKVMPTTTSDIPMNSALIIGSRVNTLSANQGHMSPSRSPTRSPGPMVTSLHTIKSPPPQSPLINNSMTASEDASKPIITNQQIIQMPSISKVYSLQQQQQSFSLANTTAATSSPKNQILSTSILSSTLLQPARQTIVSSSGQITQQNIISSQNLNLNQQSSLVTQSRLSAIGNNGQNIVNIPYSQVSKSVPVSSALNIITTSTLLHSQLTSPLKRSKSTDDPKTDVKVGHIQPTKRHSVESVIVKSEPMEVDHNETNSNTSENKTQQAQFTQQPQPVKTEESQNVLLKQLLQTSTAGNNILPGRGMTMPRSAPALGSITSLEAQLARPSIPPPSLPVTPEIPSPRQVTSREQVFMMRSIAATMASSASPTVTTTSINQSTTSSLLEVRKMPAKVTPKEEIPPSVDTFLQQPPTSQGVFQNVQIQQPMQQEVKKEVVPPQQSPVSRPYTPMDVKKELIDESSQQSATSGISTTSDQCKMEIKEEFPESLENVPEIATAETPLEARKRKRREYQKKRREMQNMKISGNNVEVNNTKKRSRKGSKFEEDYDTFIDNLMVQLRQLPPMQILEPTLTTNFNVCPLFGSGDLTKLKNKDYDLMKGDLVGEFGNARIPNDADHYNTKPFGDDEPLPEKPPASTQRGFYDQEFPPIRFDDELDDKKFDLICRERDTDTPDSIVSCSSPEMFESEPDLSRRFPGLKLIEDEDQEEEESDSGISGKMSPIFPLIAPVPVRIKPNIQVKEENENQQTNTVEPESPKIKAESPTSAENADDDVTVTLTLTSGAAEDIVGVLKQLADLLHIPPPSSYRIVERTATPPSHKLGLYRAKGRDGKESAPVDIQSILNGAAKFCRHCDVVILDSVVRAKASEFPSLAGDRAALEALGDGELCFCSTRCYERFAWRPTDLFAERDNDRDAKSKEDCDDYDAASTESMETDDLDSKREIKDEKDLSMGDSMDADSRDSEDDQKEESPFRGVKYKVWAPGKIVPPTRYRKPGDRELAELVFREGPAVPPTHALEDVRRCALCSLQGDGVADGVSRLLNCDSDKWVHLNCALWSDGVYETVSGALVNTETALTSGADRMCAVCGRLGATVKCFKTRCGSSYHVGCAAKESVVFHKNKTAFCSTHAPKGEKDNELTTLSVRRRVWISRDETVQTAAAMRTDGVLRVGALLALRIGHLPPMRAHAFHTPDYIYPVGYKVVRFYWSTKKLNARCRYLCWITDAEGKPEFHVAEEGIQESETKGPTARAAWSKVLDAVTVLRENGPPGGLKLWSHFVTGEDLFGLTEPTIVRLLESLPGVETLTDYKFKYGRSALLEAPLAINPHGCARCEPRGSWRGGWRRTRPAPAMHALTAATPTDANTTACPYSKQFVHTKSSQYKKMKMEWRNNVYLARSKIQGLGLYAARDIEKHTMVIEYIGEVIRSELSEIREKQYEAKNRGVYMFRLDERRVVDATLSGGLARYINHSCAPNCVAEAVEVDRHLRIIIFAKRRIPRGEELAYDYKFDIEDDAHKIQCMCGAPNCRKWMN